MLIIRKTGSVYMGSTSYGWVRNLNVNNEAADWLARDSVATLEVKKCYSVSFLKSVQ